MESDSIVNSIPQRKRRRIARTSAIPPLPEDIILCEILPRLPAKDLLRCRAVCRSWRRKTSTNAFLVAHHQRQPSLPLLFFHGNGDSVHGAVDAFDLHRLTPASPSRRPVLGFPDHSHRRSFKIHCSCDGLLIISLSNQRYYLCNPSTRQWCPLPALTGAGGVAALYLHGPSNKYRILFQDFRMSPPYKCNVLTVSISQHQQQRCIGQFPAEILLSPLPAHWSFIHACDHPPVFLHGCLHWHFGKDVFEGSILVFDTVLETFRLIRAPPKIDGHREYLLEMDDGKLGMGFIHFGTKTVTTDIWALEGYRKEEEWVLKRRIELPVGELQKHASESGCGNLFPQIVSGDGDVLLTTFRDPWPLFHYDGKGKLVEKYQWPGIISRVIGVYFKESLVRHDFFQKEVRGRVRVPRFFRGL